MNELICSTCQNKKDCKHTCAPLTWVNGDVKLKEKLLKRPMEQVIRSDYNNVLAEIINAKQTDMIDKIRDIDDIKKRAIASLLYAELTIVEISEITNISKAHLYRLIK